MGASLEIYKELLNFYTEEVKRYAEEIKKLNGLKGVNQCCGIKVRIVSMKYEKRNAESQIVQLKKLIDLCD